MSEATHEFTLPTHSEHHARLQPFVGTFTANVKMWMDPTQEPYESTGKMVNSWHLNRLFLHQDYQGDAEDRPFPNFQGKGYWGFNDATGCYEGFWIDTATPQFQVESGHVDESGKVWEMTSEVVCPGSGESMKKRTVITLIDQDHHKMEMFFKTSQGEMKSMEINYTRA